MGRLSREREELLEKLKASAEELQSTEGRAASGAAREREAESLLGEEARRRRYRPCGRVVSATWVQALWLQEEWEWCRSIESIKEGRVPRSELPSWAALLVIA